MGKSKFIAMKEMAHEMEISVQTLRKHLNGLIEHEGFPLPSPHCLKPMKWRREAFDRWMEGLGKTADDLRATPPGQAPGTNVHMLNAARTA